MFRRIGRYLGLLLLFMGLLKTCVSDGMSDGMPDNNNTQIWLPSDQIPCEDDYDCDLEYNICISGVCRCDINYRLVDYHCLQFNCKNNSECQSHDQNLVCQVMYNSSTCVCGSQYEFNEGKRLCQTSGNQLKWLLILVSVPLALILMSFWMCYKKGRPNDNCLESDRYEPQTPETPQTPHIVITDFQFLQSFSKSEDVFMVSPKWQTFNSNTSFDFNSNKRIIGIDSHECGTALGLT